MSASPPSSQSSSEKNTGFCLDDLDCSSVVGTTVTPLATPLIQRQIHNAAVARGPALTAAEASPLPRSQIIHLTARETGR